MSPGSTLSTSAAAVLAATVLLGSVTLLPGSVGPVRADFETSDLPLEGTPWRLSQATRRGTTLDTGPGVAASMTLIGGKIRGSGGCNRLAGRYATIGDRITFDLVDRGDRSCPEQTMAVEVSLTDGLAAAATFELAADESTGLSELVLRDTLGAVRLRFGLDDVGSLTVGEWQLQRYSEDGDTRAADPSRPAVLSFRPDRRDVRQRKTSGGSTGSTGCNGLVAPFFQQANVLSFGELEVTDAPCAADLQSQQDAMLAVLDATSQTLSLPPDGLRISSSDTGDWLEFQNSRPLEGSTLLLDRLVRQADPQSDVTLRLENGTAEGEGPCGPYRGSYETDGVRLVFSGLSGSASDGCDDARGERRLLDALRRTSLVMGAPRQVRFLDAFGRAVARFMHPGGP